MNKKELRKSYRDKRSKLTELEVQEASIKISSNLFSNTDFSKIHTAHIFLPISHHKEINTWIIIEKLWQQYPNIMVVVPKMVGEKLKTFRLKKETILENNFLGIPEPANSEEVSNEKIDLVLMPLLVFDKAGNRIGYGKGFYDKFLITCRKDIVKIGLSIFEAEEKIMTEEFDIPMDFCVTADNYYSFN